jgi:hypothetical protein
MSQTITIDIDTIRALILGGQAVQAKADAPATDATIREVYHAIVRTYADGVWIGTVVEERGCRVVLRDCRCIWSWGGSAVKRLALPELSLSGPASDDRITVQIPLHICIDAVGITPITAEIHAAWMAAPTYAP